MEIQFVGKVEDYDFEDVIVDKLGEIVDTTIARIEAENEGTVIKGAVVTEATFTIGLHIEGIEEPQLVTVEHYKGHPEVFKWVIDLDKDEQLNNEESSVFDAWSVATAKGEAKEFEEIKSIYDPTELSFEVEENFGDMDKVTLNHVDGYKVVKVYQNKKLIQEYRLTPKEISQ